MANVQRSDIEDYIERVRISSDDRSALFLSSKLIAGTDITLNTLDAGGSEVLEINASGGGGASSLDDLSDVSVTSPTDGQTLIYNGTNFANEDMSASDITDVSADSDSDAHHSKTSSASELSDVSPDSTSDAHHSKTSSASELTDVSADSDADAHHSKTSSASELTDVSPDSTSDAHHSKTSSASELSDVSADSVSDAHHAATVATDLNGTGLNASGGNLVLDEATLKDGGSKELDVADLAGGDGTSGQVAQTDGAAVSWNTMQASDISDVSADSVSDAHHAATTASDLDGTGTTASGGSLDLDETVLKDGGAKELDAADLAGGVGTDGQVLTSTGSGAQWEDAGGGASELSDLSDASVSTPSAGQTLLYHGTNSQFENAGITDGTGISKATGDASLTLSLDEAVIKDGGAKEVDADELAGGNGTSGQFIRTDGSALSYVTPSASDISDVSADSVSDAHHAQTTATDLDGDGTTASGGNLDLDEAVIKDGGTKEIDASEFAGSSGTDGQVLTSTGSAAQWESPSGGGSAITLDLGNDGSNESTDLAKITDINDPSGVTSEPNADELRFDWSGLLSTDNLYHIRDEKSAGTNGGSSSSDTRNTRDLNTEVVANVTNASLSSNTVTLPAGTYWCEARAPCEVANRSRLILRNTSDGSDELLGASKTNFDNDSSFSDDTIKGKFTISSSKNYQLLHYTEIGASGNGLGEAVSNNTSENSTEYYAELMFWKVA